MGGGGGLKLGTRVRDVVTDWEGVLTAHCRYLFGDDRYEVTGTDDLGKPHSEWYDLDQLVRVVQQPETASER